MKKFVVWGCELHRHTNSYIYAGIYKAAIAMGLDAYWLNENSDISGMNFFDTIFVTEGQHDKGIPVRDDCFYVLHNCTDSKWNDITNKIFLQTYTYDADHKWGAKPLENYPGTYVIGNGIWQPWATDLLPNEIDLDWVDIPRSMEIHWVGTIGGGRFGNENEINPFKNTANTAGCSWHYHPPGSTSFEQNKQLIQRSFLAPTITGQWQTEMGYIPCRIFKNSSYGHLMATNNKASFDLLEGLGVYSFDTSDLFDKARSMRQNKSLVLDSMKLIRDKHTFINRVNAILSIIRS